MINTNDKQSIQTIGELLQALDSLPHVCKFEIVRGGCSDGVPVWKCECGKKVKSS